MAVLLPVVATFANKFASTALGVEQGGVSETKVKSPKEELAELVEKARREVDVYENGVPKEEDKDWLFDEGVKYMEGEEVEMDKFKSFSLLMKSARKGSEKAQKQLDKLCKESPWACK